MTDELKTFWNFDDADLAANRNGQLTEKQQKFLVGEHKTQRGVFIGVGAALALIFCCLPVLLFGARGLLPLLFSGLPSDPTEMIPLIAMGGFGLVFFVIIGVVIAAVVGFYLLRANKKAELTVKTAKGTVTYTWGTKRVRTPGSKVRNYEDVRVLHLNISDKKFEVKETLQDIIKANETWVIYYTSEPFKFLSGEKSG